MPYPDQFYPVVDSVAWVARLAALGVGTIQLRAKDLNDFAALQIVTDALAAIGGTATKLVVNDYWRAAIVAGARHLHLGQEDLADADLTAIRDAGLTLGISTHDDAELETALRAKPDYIALGPIFPTTLKSMRFAPQGIAKISEWKKRIGDDPAGRDRRHQARTGARDFCRRRRFASPSSATSPRMPTRTRGCAPGSVRTWRPREMNDNRQPPPDRPPPQPSPASGGGSALRLFLSPPASETHSSPLPLAGEGGALARARRVGALAQRIELPYSGSVRVPRSIRNDEQNSQEDTP